MSDKTSTSTSTSSTSFESPTKKRKLTPSPIEIDTHDHTPININDNPDKNEKKQKCDSESDVDDYDDDQHSDVEADIYELLDDCDDEQLKSILTNIKQRLANQERLKWSEEFFHLSAHGTAPTVSFAKGYQIMSFHDKYHCLLGCMEYQNYCYSFHAEDYKKLGEWSKSVNFQCIKTEIENNQKGKEILSTMIKHIDESRQRNDHKEAERVVAVMAAYAECFFDLDVCCNELYNPPEIRIKKQQPQPLRKQRLLSSSSSTPTDSLE